MLLKVNALSFSMDPFLQMLYFQKEVARLQGMVNGGAEDLDNDASAVSFPGSPGIFKWEGLHASCSPLTSDKRTSQVRNSFFFLSKQSYFSFFFLKFVSSFFLSEERVRTCHCRCF